MLVVAITRQMGALGTEVSERVGAALKVPVVHDQLAKAIANRWNIDAEVVRGLQSSLLPRMYPIGSRAMALVSFIRHALLEAAGQHPGAVFRGWGAAQFLPEAEHVVRVFVGAPMAVRCERVSARRECSISTAETLIREHDAIKARLARDHARVDWTNPDGYDLIINTARTTVSDAVREISGLARARGHSATKSLDELIERARLEALARATLLQDRATASLHLMTQATSRGLIVMGIVDSGDQREAAVAALSKAITVVPIVSQIRARTDYRTRTSSI